MKHWMKSLAIPAAAIAGGMLASNAFADPRAVLDKNHSNHGSIARSSASTDGTANPAERAQVATERIHMQTQAQQAAMGGEAGSERTGDSADVQRKSEHAKADKKQQAIGIHLGAGDNPAERETGGNVAKSSSAKTGRANKDGERPHFSAAQAEEMGSSQPARDDGQGQSTQKQHTSAQNKEVAAKGGGEQLHLSPQQMQEMTPEGAGNSDKAGPSSRSPSFERTEARFGREMPEPRAQVIHHEQPNFHLPQAFYH